MSHMNTQMKPYLHPSHATKSCCCCVGPGRKHHSPGPNHRSCRQSQGNCSLLELIMFTIFIIFFLLVVLLYVRMIIISLYLFTSFFEKSIYELSQIWKHHHEWPHMVSFLPAIWLLLVYGNNNKKRHPTRILWSNCTVVGFSVKFRRAGENARISLGIHLSANLGKELYTKPASRPATRAPEWEIGSVS